MKFHYSNHLIDINSVDTDKMIISIKISFSKIEFRYFICYKDDEKIKPLCK